MDIFKEPVCLIGADKSNVLTISSKAVNQLEMIDCRMVVVSVVGLYRTGKSYLMNRLAQSTSGFELGDTIESKTKGIWAWCKIHPEKSNTVLLLLDTEGLGNVDKGDPNHDNKIFTLATLLCNCLVYNMKGAFDQDAVNKLTFVTEMASNIRYRGKSSEDKQTLNLILPDFVLCVRDFSLKLIKDGRQITEDEYLELSLEEKKGKDEKFNKPRECIKKFFHKRKCITFPVPWDGYALENLEKLKFDQLSAKFKEATIHFTSYVYNKKPKELVASKPVNGLIFATLANHYVTAIRHGAVPDVDDAFIAVAKKENAKIEKEAIEIFESQMKRIVMPVAAITLEQCYTSAQQTALNYLRKVIVHDKDGTFESQAQAKMDTIWKELKEENSEKIKERCETKLQKAYSKSLKGSIEGKVFEVAGGYRMFQRDLEILKDEYFSSLRDFEEHEIVTPRDLSVERNEMRTQSVQEYDGVQLPINAILYHTNGNLYITGDTVDQIPSPYQSDRDQHQSLQTSSNYYIVTSKEMKTSDSYKMVSLDDKESSVNSHDEQDDLPCPNYALTGSPSKVQKPVETSTISSKETEDDAISIYDGSDEDRVFEKADEEDRSQKLSSKVHKITDGENIKLEHVREDIQAQNETICERLDTNLENGEDEMIDKQFDLQKDSDEIISTTECSERSETNWKGLKCDRKRFKELQYQESSRRTRNGTMKGGSKKDKPPFSENVTKGCKKQTDASYFFLKDIKSLLVPRSFTTKKQPAVKILLYIVLIMSWAAAVCGEKIKKTNYCDGQHNVPPDIQHFDNCRIAFPEEIQESKNYKPVSTLVLNIRKVQIISVGIINLPTKCKKAIHQEPDIKQNEYVVTEEVCHGNRFYQTTEIRNSSMEQPFDSTTESSLGPLIEFKAYVWLLQGMVVVISVAIVLVVKYRNSVILLILILFDWCKPPDLIFQNSARIFCRVEVDSNKTFDTGSPVQEEIDILPTLCNEKELSEGSHELHKNKKLNEESTSNFKLQLKRKNEEKDEFIKRRRMFAISSKLLDEDVDYCETLQALSLQGKKPINYDQVFFLTDLFEEMRQLSFKKMIRSCFYLLTEKEEIETKELLIDQECNQDAASKPIHKISDPSLTCLTTEDAEVYQIPGIDYRINPQITNTKPLQSKQRDDIDSRDDEEKVLKTYVLKVERQSDKLNKELTVLPENMTEIKLKLKDPQPEEEQQIPALDEGASALSKQTVYVDIGASIDVEEKKEKIHSCEVPSTSECEPELIDSAFLRNCCNDTFMNLKSKSSENVIPKKKKESSFLKFNEILPQPLIDISFLNMNAYFVFDPLMVIIDQIANGTPPTPHISMRYELLRFCTLRSYPKENKPFIIKLAEAGFYYASDGDGVVCYCCGIRRYNWVEEDIPMKIHKRVNPNCKFLKKNEEVNVPVQYFGPYSEALMKIMDIPEPVEREDRSEDVNNDWAPERIRSPAASQQNRQSESAANSLGINTATPKHTQYATKTARVGSYSGWPDTASHTPEVLADAGFFYAGFGDCVRCFYCGIGLRHWTKEDDPWIEHARWARNCVFVKQKKGEEFVNLVQMSVQQSQENEMQAQAQANSNAGNQLPVQDIERLLLSDAAQSVLDMGYQPRMIRNALEQILGKNGNIKITAQILMEKVLEIEESESQNQAAPVAQAAASATASASAASPLTKPEAESANAESAKSEGAKAEGAKAESAKASSKPETEKQGAEKAKQSKDKDEEEASQDPKVIKAENEQLKEQTLCKVCLDNTVCIVFLPCGHLVTCADCAPAMRKCPICRALVKGTVRTYMS